ARLRAAGFTPVVQVAPQSRVDSKCAAGQVAQSDPSGRTVRGVPVALFLSSGKAPQVPNPGPSGGPGPGPGGGGARGGGGAGRGGGGRPPPAVLPHLQAVAVTLRQAPSTCRSAALGFAHWSL